MPNNKKSTTPETKSQTNTTKEVKEEVKQEPKVYAPVCSDEGHRVGLERIGGGSYLCPICNGNFKLQNGQVVKNV